MWTCEADWFQHIRSCILMFLYWYVTDMLWFKQCEDICVFFVYFILCKYSEVNLYRENLFDFIVKQLDSPMTETTPRTSFCILKIQNISQIIKLWSILIFYWAANILFLTQIFKLILKERFRFLYCPCYHLHCIRYTTSINSMLERFSQYHRSSSDIFHLAEINLKFNFQFILPEKWFFVSVLLQPYCYTWQ
jgi:hypothetical protein